MEPQQELINALSSTPESLERDYKSAELSLPGLMKEKVPSRRSIGLSVISLPNAWRSTQLALARFYKLPMEKRPDLHTDGFSTGTHIDRSDEAVLRQLLVVLYHSQIETLIKEMNEAGTNSELQKGVLGRMAEPLRCYTEARAAVEASEEHDIIRTLLASWYENRYPTLAKQLTTPVPSWIDKLVRQLVALVGGLSLVVPVIMMTFLTSITARLSIVCCASLGFSIFIGIATKASNQEVLGASAAYTAVLVVFVGTSTAGQR